MENIRKWEIDLIIPINQPSNKIKQKLYFITTICYCTKWVEVKVCITDDTPEWFSYKNMIVCFGYLCKLVSDRASYFVNKVIIYLLTK
mgnify:FL=1